MHFVVDTPLGSYTSAHATDKDGEKEMINLYKLMQESLGSGNVTQLTFKNKDGGMVVLAKEMIINSAITFYF